MDGTLLDLAESPGLWLPPEPDREVADAGGCTVVTSGPSAWVHRIRLAGGDVEAAVERVRELLRARAHDEVTWWAGERSTPADLAARLAEFGLEPDDPAELTTLTIASRPAGTPAVEVRRVETHEDYLRALEIDWECFDVPDADRNERRRAAPAAWLLQQADGRSSVYLAFLDGRPVGFGRAVFTPWAALLLGGATLPEARGRGVYTAVVHARWDEAVERAVPRIVVSAGPMSGPILERLGFTPLGRVRLMHDAFSPGR